MIFSRSHHYAQLGNALQKHFFPYFALIIGTLKGCRFFSLSVQKSMATKRADIQLI